MNGYHITYGPTVKFQSDDITVANDGVGVEIVIDTEDGARLKLTNSQAQQILIGLRLTGTNLPEWLV